VELQEAAVVLVEHGHLKFFKRICTLLPEPLFTPDLFDKAIELYPFNSAFLQEMLTTASKQLNFNYRSALVTAITHGCFLTVKWILLNIPRATSDAHSCILGLLRHAVSFGNKAIVKLLLLKLSVTTEMIVKMIDWARKHWQHDLVAVLEDEYEDRLREKRGQKRGQKRGRNWD
jgi:hypothetical protein